MTADYYTRAAPADVAAIAAELPLDVQLTLDGGEVGVVAVANSRSPLTEGQTRILRLIVKHDVSSSDAGRVLHLARKPPCQRCKRGSCAFVASDGSEALERLAKRGLVRRVAKGVWTVRR